MVGMSGKSGETRRTGRTGGASVVAPGKKVDHHPPQPVVKPKASAEQVNIANILGDSNALPTNMEERIAQVMAVVSSKSEEEVTIALHDNDYCVETAIDTLLDSSSDMKDVWSQPVTRKNKKKSLVENDPAQVITDTSSKSTTPQGAGGSRVNPRAAAQHTRENYGGTVTVVEHPRGAGKGGGRDRGRSQSSGRSRKEKGETKQERDGRDGEGRRGKGDQRTDRERGDDYKSERGGGGRESSGGGNGGRRDRGERGEKGDRGDRRSNGGSRPRRRDQKPKEGGASNTSGSTSFSRHRHTKERWSTEPATGEDIETTQQQQLNEQEPPSVPATSTAVWFSSQDVWQGEVSLNPREQWEPRHPPAPQASSSQSCSVFPEALLAQPGMTTPPVTPPVTREGVHVEEPVTKAPPTRTSKGKYRTRKYLPSQIPSEPVEMPSGVDTVSLKMSSLGIDFMSKEPLSSPTVKETTPTATTPTTHPYESSIHSPQPPLLSNPVPTGGALLPTPSYPSTFPTDSSVLPIPPSLETATSPFPSQKPATPVTSHTEVLPTTLEPPPGLTHPSKHTEKSTTPSHLQQGLLPEPLTLPTHSTQATPTDMLSSHIPSAPKPSLAQLPTPSASSYPSPLGSMALPPETTPAVKMSQQASGVSYAAPNPSTTSASIPHTSSEPLFSNKPPQTNVPTVATRQHHTGGPTNTASSSAGGLISASSVNPQRSSGKQHGGGNVQHPTMLYQPTAPGMLPYYTHAPPVVMPPYAGGPYTDMERYPFYPHATSQEQAPSSVNRDHVSSSYATDAASKQLDMATAISSSALPQQQQQQQQGALQHPYYYPHHNNMLAYSLYAAQVQAAQAQAAQFQMGHKPGVTTTFATSYQHNPQFSGLTGYEDNAAQDYKHFPGGSSLGKSSNVPSTSTASDFQQHFKFEKQQQQQQPGYGYPLPHQSTAYLGGPAAAFMPMVPHLPPGPLMTTPHETSRPKHGGKTPYMAQSTNNLF